LYSTAYGTVRVVEDITAPAMVKMRRERNQKLQKKDVVVKDEERAAVSFLPVFPTAYPVLAALLLLAFVV
jgi:hypothetical protein